MFRPLALAVISLLVLACGHLWAEEDLQPLLIRAQQEPDIAVALTLLDEIQDKLNEGLPDDAKARAKLWLAIADERMRRWSQHEGEQTATELEELMEAHRSACGEAADAGDWPLVRAVAERVFQRTKRGDDRFIDLRRTAVELERFACQKMADQAGEAQALLRLLEEPAPGPYVGERRSDATARVQAQLDLITDARRLLANQESSLLILDGYELDAVKYSGLPALLNALARARAHAEKIGVKAIPERWRQAEILTRLAEAAEQDRLVGWSAETRQVATALWKIRIQEADQETASDDPSERTGTLIQQVQARRIASLIAGEQPAAGIPPEFTAAVRTLPPPESGASAAAARMWLSSQAQRYAPEGDEWVAWAQSAYAANPGLTHWCDENQVHIPGSHTAVDWNVRSQHSDARGRIICLREAAKAWAELGRTTHDWLPLAYAEECLRHAGLPAGDYLPKIDPDRAHTQGPDAATLDRLCRQLANIPRGENVEPALANLLAFLRLAYEPLPPPGQRGGGEHIDLYTIRPYTGQLDGITRTALAWRLGKPAAADLASAYANHAHPALVDLIGWLGGTHASTTLQALWPSMQQRPDDLATWLPALQYGASELLPGWLAVVLPLLEDRSLSFLAWRAGRSLQGPALERVADEVLRRGNGEVLEGVMTWWASDHQRLDASRLLDLWQRVHHWELLRIKIIPCLVATNDPRIPWWLLAVADGRDSELIRAEAVNGLALLQVPEAAALCHRLLSVTSDEKWLQSAALLTAGALGHGERHRELAKRWIAEMPDDPEDERVRAARCLLAALDGGGEHRAWIEQAATQGSPHSLIRDLCSTRLAGAHAPAFALVQGVRSEWLREDLDNRLLPFGWNMKRAARWVSLLPLDAAQRQEWERLLQQPIPPPSPENNSTPSWEFADHPPSPGLRPSR